MDGVMVEQFLFIKLGTADGASRGRLARQNPDANPPNRSRTEARNDDGRENRRDESSATRWTLRFRQVTVAAIAGFLTADGFGTPTSAQTPGAVYAFHSDEVGDCPPLEWSIVVGGNNTLSGIIAWDSMRKMARVFGTVAADGSFHMDATDVSGAGKNAVIDGQLMASGWLTAAIKGPGIDCQNIKVPMYKPASQ